MMAEIVPSSARSSSSAALQLPSHLVPLLEDPLERLRATVDKILPRNKAKSALEEAEFEDEIGDDLQKHAMIHCELSRKAPSFRADWQHSIRCGRIDLGYCCMVPPEWGRDTSARRYCIISKDFTCRVWTSAIC
jgi:hypothetical protein